jgi:hypothetical protein
VKLWTIGILTIKGREQLLKRCLNSLDFRRIPSNVEILIVFNKSIKEGRNYVLENAKGKFVSFIDDDDFVADDYVPEILDVIKTKEYIDAVAFKGKIRFNGGAWFNVIYGHKIDKNAIEMTRPVYYRRLNHICVIKKDILKGYQFTEDYGEDIDLANYLSKEKLNTCFINKTLYYYDFRTKPISHYSKSDN